MGWINIHECGCVAVLKRTVTVANLWALQMEEVMTPSFGEASKYTRLSIQASTMGYVT